MFVSQLISRKILVSRSIGLQIVHSIFNDKNLMLKHKLQTNQRLTKTF